MIALLRKDLTWLLPALIAGLCVVVAVLMQDSFVRHWVLPPTALEGIFHASWISGAALGLLAACHDELLGTREFLRHRPLTPARLHAAKMIGCALAITTSIVLGLALHWLLEIIFGRYAGAGTLHNWGRIVAAMLPAATSGSIVLFAATLPISPILRLFVAFSAFLVVFTLIDVASTLSLLRLTDLTIFVTWHLGMTALFSAASFATLPHVADPDRPWSMRARVVGCGLTVLVVALFYSSLFGLGARELVSKLGHSYPSVGHHEGEFMLYQRSYDREAQASVFHRIDRQHRWQDTLDSAPERIGHGGNSATDGYLRHPQFGFHEPSFVRVRSSDESSILFTDGLVYTRVTDHEAGTIRYHSTGKGPGHAPFDADASLIVSDDHRFVLESSEDRLWHIGSDMAHFVEIRLPDGDRPVAFSKVSPEASAGSETIGRQPNRNQTQRLNILIGERSIYQPSGATFISAPEWAKEAVKDRVKDPVKQSPFRTEVTQDNLGGHLRVHDEQGAVVFEHDFSPRTLKEISLATAIVGVSLIRPPFLAVLSSLTEPDPRSRSSLLDRLVVGGKRFWVVLLTFGLSTLLAFLVHRRLTNLGAAPAVRWFWTGAIVLLGPVAAVLSALIESNRAYAPSPAGQKKNVLRISSPAA